MGLGASDWVVDSIGWQIAPGYFGVASGEEKRAAAASGKRQGGSVIEMEESGVMVGQGSCGVSSVSHASEEEEDEDETGVNGEVVRRGVERAQVVESVRAGIWGFGFLMSIVGIWGDWV